MTDLIARRTLVDRLEQRRETVRAASALARQSGDEAALADNTAALEELRLALELTKALEPRPDLADVTRPGVLLVGAGIRGDVVVRADAETLNLDLMSDRDLAVYAGLLSWVTERLLDEQGRRRYPLHTVTVERNVTQILGDPDLSAIDPQERAS